MVLRYSKTSQGRELQQCSTKTPYPVRFGHAGTMQPQTYINILRLQHHVLQAPMQYFYAVYF